MTQRLSVFVVVLCSLLFMLAGSAGADSTAVIESLQAQIKSLQEQLDALKAEQAKQAEEAAKDRAARAAAAPAQVQAPAEAGAGKTMFANTAVKVTLGGFIEAAGIYRNMYAGSDVNSKWNLGSGGFPLPNSPNYYMDELRGTARQSRLSLLAQGQEDYASLAAYFEADFLGGGSGTSGNSQESNSYNPRIRHLYGTYDTTSGWHLLAGQSWSLLTMDKKGIVPRQENIPLTIDAQYVPGFTWTRNPQVRLVRDFGDMVSAGLSLEAPQAIITGGQLPSGSAVNYTYKLANPANFAYVTGTTNNSNLPGSLSLDQYPDIVGKVALDPGFGHYEAYALGRFFTDRTLITGTRDNNTTFGFGAGGALLVPVVAKYLDAQGSFLAGQGIGRYGSAGLNDAVVNPITGKLDPLSEVEALIGIVGHPTDLLDIYGYVGFEQESRKDVLGATGGFGNPAFASQLLLTEGAATGNFTPQASTAEQATLGFWYSFYKGNYGLMKVGLSDALTRLRIFAMPNETMNTVMVSFRYYPF
jgi:outer membrane murein-binding lipoprotein Lpp